MSAIACEGQGLLCVEYCSEIFMKKPALALRSRSQKRGLAGSICWVCVNQDLCVRNARRSLRRYFRITVFAVAMNREKNFPDSGSSLSSSMNNNLTQGE